MLRQTVQLFVVMSGLAIASGAWAQERAWSIDATPQREAKVVARYRQLLLQNPDRPVIYRSLIAKLGRGPSLDPFIAQIERFAQDSDRAEPWILLGHLQRDRANDDASHAAYLQATVLEPQNYAAYAALGASHDRRGEGAQADAAYERALELAGSARQRRELLRRLADLAAARSDVGRAAHWLSALVDLKPRDRELRVELAETLLRSARFDDALQTYRVALQLAGSRGKLRAQTLLDIGEVYLRMEDPPAAEIAFRDALRLVGRNSWMRREILMQLVVVARARGTIDSIYAELEREWNRPSYHDTMVLVGLAEELGRAGDAVRWLRHAVLLDNRAIEPRTRLIAHLDPVEDREQIESIYDELVRLRPAELARRIDRIEWAYFQAQRPKEALEGLAELQAQHAESPDAMIEIADAWLRMGLPDAALRIHEQLDVSHPNDPGHLESYGSLLMRLDRAESAAGVWQRLIDANPDDVRTRIRVGELATRHGDFAGGAELYEWVLERQPTLHDVRQRLAAAYEAQKLWAKALQHWEYLYEHGAEHAGRSIVAIAHRTVFIGDQAVSPDPALLGRWERRFSERPTVRNGLLLVQLRRASGYGDEALTLHRKLVSLDPAALPTSEHLAWVTLAQELAQGTTNREALRIYERIAEAFGDRRVSSWRRAIDLAVRLDDSATIARALAAVPNSAYVHAVAGNYFGANGDADVGITHLRRAIALGTQSFHTHFDLAFLLRGAGRDAEAVATYMDVVSRCRVGSLVTSASFSIIDLAEDDATLRALEAQLPGLPGRVSKAVVREIALALYYQLFVYGDRSEQSFAEMSARALPLIVGAIESSDFADQERASELIRLFDPEEVAAAALRVWPADAAQWTAVMVGALAVTRAPAAEPALVSALGSDDIETRRVAAFAVGLARAKSGAPALVRLLNDAALIPTDRALVAAALGRIDTAEAREALGRLGEGQGDPSGIAVWGLGQGRSDEAATLLEGRLTHPSERIRRLAAVMLRRLDGDAGLRRLLRSAWGESETARAVAVRALRASDGPDVWASDYEDFWSPQETMASEADLADRVEADQPVARAFVGRESLVVGAARESIDRPRMLTFLVEAADEADRTDADELAPSIRRVVLGLRPELRRLIASSDPRLVAPSALLLPRARVVEDAPLVAGAAAELPEPEASRVVESMTTYPWPAIRPVLAANLRAGSARRRATSLRALAAFREALADEQLMRQVRVVASDDTGDVQVAAIEALGALRDDDSAALLAGVFEGAAPESQRAIRSALRRMNGEVARRAYRDLRIQLTLPICEGDPNDLTELLSDACAGAVDIPDF